MHVLTRVGVLAAALSCAAWAAPSGAGGDSAGSSRSAEPRRSFYTTGVAVGYLLPQSGTYSYTRSTGGLFGDTETESPARILRISMLNMWRFDNLMLATDGSIGVLPDRFILGADLGLDYVFGHGMATPFVGGAVGIRHGPIDDGPGDKLNTGPALSAQGGMLIFGGYDVNVLIRGQYSMTFTEDRDRGFVVDAGVVYAFQADRSSRR